MHAALGLLVATVAFPLPSIPQQTISRRCAVVHATSFAIAATAAPVLAIPPLCESDEETNCRRPYVATNMGGKNNPNQARNKDLVKQKEYEKAKRENQEARDREARSAEKRKLQEASRPALTAR